MTLDELIAWVDGAMPRLPRDRKVRDRVRHVRRLYGILDDQGVDGSFRREWHALACRIAALLDEPAPAKPRDRSPLPPERKRWKPAPAPIAHEDRPVRRRTARAIARPSIEMNPQLEKAFRAVESGREIVFVTGGAGTGKSTFIREMRERFRDKPSVVLAPTGIAALTAGGQTIHSFCRLPLRPVRSDDARKVRDPELIEKLELVVIDEISMVRADILDGVDAFLRLNRIPDRPFGGVQMVLVGDLFQLPPVVTSRDAEEIARRYPTPHFFSARALQGLRFFPVELEIVYRQQDRTFAQLLARIRDGNDAREALRRLNEACAGREPAGPHLVLVPTRNAAAAQNEVRLAELRGKARRYTARREGTFEGAPDDRLPAPPELVLKKGAQVMFVRNDFEQRWVNGTVGIVTAFEHERIEVSLEDGTTHEVERVEWEDITYTFDREKNSIVEEVTGTYVQFPLMLAWAVTIHKAQGLTLDRVLVDLDRGAFAEGQVYVALSRCRSMEGLSLRRPVRPGEVRCSQAALSFYAKMRSRVERASPPLPDPPAGSIRP